MDEHLSTQSGQQPEKSFEVVDAPADSKTACKYRVLVVDDNKPSAQTMGWMLELLGHEVELLYDGNKLLENAKLLKPHVILLDIGLPGMSGYDLCKMLRQDAETKDTIIVAQTGWGQEEHRRLSLSAGFNHHLVKPIDMHLLENILTTVKSK